MRRMLPTLTLTLAALLATGCDAASGRTANSLPAVPAELAALQGCMAGSVETLALTLAGLADLMDELQDPLSSTSLTPTVDPKIWYFGLGRLSGTATFSRDPAGSPRIGDTVTLDWEYNDGASTYGGGQFISELTGPSSVTMFGTGGFDDTSTVCVLNVVIDEGAPMLLDLTGIGSLATNVSGAEIVGVMAAMVSEDGNRLTADFVFEDGVSVLKVVNADYNGTAIADFSIPLPPSP